METYDFPRPMPACDVPIVHVSTYYGGDREVSEWHQQSIVGSPEWAVMYGARIAMRRQYTSAYEYFYAIGKRLLKRHNYRPRHLLLNYRPGKNYTTARHYPYASRRGNRLGHIVAELILRRETPGGSYAIGWSYNHLIRALDNLVERKIGRVEAVCVEGDIHYNDEMSADKWHALLGLASEVHFTQELEENSRC